MLISANQTQSSLLPTLVGPQAARYMVKHSVGYSSYNGGHRAVHTPYQMQQQHQYRNTRPSTSEMQHQAQWMMPSTSKVQSPFQKTRVESRTRPQTHHQFQKPTRSPSIPQVQSQFQRPRPESYPINFANQRPFQIQQNQGQMWRPKSDK